MPAKIGPDRLVPWPMRITPRQLSMLKTLREVDGESIQHHVRAALDRYLGVELLKIAIPLKEPVPEQSTVPGIYHPATGQPISLLDYWAELRSAN